MKEFNGNPQLIRSINERRILELTSAHAPLSRAEISRLTGLSKPTVSAAVKNLLELGLVEEIGQGEAGPGRKPTLVQFSASYRHVLGIQLGADRIRVVLADLQAQPLLSGELSMRDNSDNPEELLQAIHSQAEHLLAEAGIDWEHVGYAAFAIPGVVSATGDVTMLAPHLQGCESALTQASLAARFPCPVLTDNDVNLAAWAEFAANNQGSEEVFAFLFLDSGVGAGIMIGGRLLRGLGGAAGELGDMRLADGSRLEEKLSEQALLDRARATLASSSEPSLLGQADSLTLATLFDAAKAGDGTACQALDGYVEELTAAVHNLTALLAPERIVLGGRIGEDPLLLQALGAMLFNLRSAPPQMVSATLGGESVLTGAVQTAIAATMRQIQEEL